MRLEETLPGGRQARHWSNDEKTKVREMFIGGHSWDEISEAVGCKSTTLRWLRTEGAFGQLPDRKGQRGKGCQRARPADDEHAQTLFGCKREAWQQRLEQINSSWSAEERARRRAGELPGNEIQYGLRPEHHKDRASNDWEIRRIP